ncbi:Os09g0343900 [Oryza sativa Japonica Group]|uniref:Os09g0343900 protein n=1 Tax=Oryza sativa subsp. japonica TaxID=39947 RepID=C7J6M0_ORYSJ|nr:Os09g0343900 [Oryza sativa Japonica Group]|eukprot:NP_001175789.1 Os09g0343900 [Oryza sativa Japonica Group]
MSSLSLSFSPSLQSSRPPSPLPSTADRSSTPSAVSGRHRRRAPATLAVPPLPRSPSLSSVPVEARRGGRRGGKWRH